MPLSEFLKMARGKLGSAEQKATVCPTDISSAHDNDLVELVWENGQIIMLGQSNRAKKSPTFYDTASQVPGIRDKLIQNVSNPKVTKLGVAESILDGGPPSVPRGEISFSRDDETVPWLNYSVDDTFRQDYFSDLLPELSGVTGNVPSMQNSFASVDKRNCSQMGGHSQNVPIHNDVNIELQSASKVCTSSADSISLCLPRQGQIPVPSLGSGVPNIRNSSGHNPEMYFGDPVQNHTSGDGFMNMKTQNQNLGSSGSASHLLNFSHFSRPAAVFRANLQKTHVLASSCSPVVEKMGIEEDVPAASGRIPMKSTFVEPSSNSRKQIGFHDQPNLFSAKVDSRPSVDEPLKESCPAEPDAWCQEDSVKSDKSPGQAVGSSTTRGVIDAEKTVELVIAASSVCSGNSAERASNDQMNNLKRKYRDNEESESRSEDIEEDSVSMKKQAPARGGSGSKRSRAAEVHNLSERRRRDRINEKMRALQELIPNCNKADKASMLDEAIEYLKTLQLQVQIMSMGTGLFMPPLMFPTGLQHMHAAHMPYFSHVRSGMGVGMGFGMGMLDMNSGSPRLPIFPIPPMAGAHFPSPPISGPSTLQGVAGSSLPVFGHPGPGMPTSVPTAPLVPMLGQHPISSTVGLNAPRMGIPVVAQKASPAFNTDVSLQNKNLQQIFNANASSTMNQMSGQLQAADDACDPVTLPKDDPVADACGTATVNLTNANDAMSSKEGND